MRKLGLLMETQIQDPTDPEEKKVLSQFVHLSIQEVLAMVGLMNKSIDEIKTVVKQFAKSQQFNMALLFLYGLVFDTSNEYSKKLFPSSVVESSLRKAIKPVLLDLLNVSFSVCM